MPCLRSCTPCRGAKDWTPFETVSDIPFYEAESGIIACAGGVSKVNAAMAAEILCLKYGVDLILNAGVAGCLTDLPTGSLVVPDEFIQHDVDTTAIGDPVGLVSTVNQIRFPTADLPAAKAAMDATGVPYRTGWVATGDWFATDTPRSHWIADTFHPLLCEMEGCAVAQVCLRNGVKFMAIKSVSDCLFEHHDFAFNFPAAMKDLNRVVMAFLTQLTKE